MTEEMGFESDQTRNEIADYLENFAEGLRGDEPVDVDVGDSTVSVNPPESVEFEIEVEDEGEIIGDDVERTVEFELEWMTQEEEEELPVN